MFVIDDCADVRADDVISPQMKRGMERTFHASRSIIDADLELL